MTELSIADKWEEKQGNFMGNLVWCKRSADTCEAFLFVHAFCRERISSRIKVTFKGKGEEHYMFCQARG